MFDYIVNNFLLFFVVPFIALLAASGIVITFLDIRRFKNRSTTTNSVLGRDKEIEQLAGRILAGRSTALVGIFDQERKDMLDVLRNPQNFGKLYGEEANRLIFSYVDISTFTRENTPVDFWQRALMPLESVESQKIRALCKTYAADKDNQYQNYPLEKLLEQLRMEGLRLVLMVHKFDLLLQLDSFKIGFFALLRSLASSRHPSAFVPVITMNMTVAQLMSSNKIVGLMGSNLLDYIEGLILAPLPDKQIKSLLTDLKYADMASDLTGHFPHLVSWFNTVLQEVKPELEIVPAIEEAAKVELIKKIFMQRVDRTLQYALNSHFFLTNGESLSLKELLGKLSTVPQEDKKELEKMGVLLKANETYQPNPSIFNKFTKS